MTRKKLPIGIQTFAKIRDADYYYVDKTPMAWRLTQESGYYFTRSELTGRGVLT